MNKKSFSLIELIFALAIMTIILLSIKFTYQSSRLNDAANKLKLYLNYTRYIAFLDNKQEYDNNEYKKQLWTVKFQHCSKKVGGVYFVIYSDNDPKTSHFKKIDCLKDPLSNKYLYSNWDCNAAQDESKYILLTKQYGVDKITLSCNTTSTIGQISFGNDGKIYSNLGNTPKEIKEKCYLIVFDKKGDSKKLTIEPNNGYIH